MAFILINLDTGVPVQEEELVADRETGLLRYETHDLVFDARPRVVGNDIWDTDATGQPRLRLGGVSFPFEVRETE